MKILVLGNYAPNRQESMQRFAALIFDLFTGAGHEVRLLRPAASLGELSVVKSGPAKSGIGKSLGYVDQFLLFPRRLRMDVEWADVIHICDQANAIHVPRLLGKPHVVSCHDLLAIRSALGQIPENPTRWTGRIYQRWILSGLRNAQRVVCVSEQTRRELIAVANLPAARTTVVPNALNYFYRPMPPAECRVRLHSAGFDQSFRFFLHVGGNQWYKNRLGVVRIFRHLAALPRFADHHLVMVGKRWTDDVRRLVSDSGLADRVHEAVSVSNEDLRAFYSAADALIFPSLQEGFGWPIAEAQACGCPVFTTNRPPMTEVGADAAVYFDPSDPQAVAMLIAERMRGAEDISARGIENAKRFTAAAMAAGYLSALEEVVTVSATAGFRSEH